MVGLGRLDHLQACVEDVLARGVPGDLLEAGAWRGGASILMRAVLRAHGVGDRRVWVADSFAGLPPPRPEVYPADAGLRLHECAYLAVPLARVRANFDRYGLLDDQVGFLAGWFRDTLPAAPVGALAVLRLDGDMYESTTDALTHLYPKLSAGGYLVVDDYGDIAACRQAVDDYRRAHGIREAIVPVDWTGVSWRRGS
jgi:O-methyltransferase